jgi:NAD+ synthase (glutamine-hydrolysing)
MAPLRVALAQINPTVGDIAGNARLVNEYIAAARTEEASVVVFPELALTGYPPEDLLLKTHFLDAVGDALEDIAAQTQGIVAVVGFPERADDVYNAAALLADGQVSAVYRKMYLPNYGVFDEQRYFQNGQRPAVFELDDVTVGVTVCDDIWEPGPPATTEALAGARLIVNLSASPYHAGKGNTREQMLRQRARDNLAAVAFCNSVGGQDELVFDGHSLLLDWDGQVVARAPQFKDSLTVGTIDPAAAAGGRLRDPRHRTNVRRRRRRADAGIPQFEVERLAELSVEAPTPREVTTGPVDPPMELEAEIYSALRLGVRDYVDKNGFSSVVIALSGGIDSALVALVAADALGADRVSCVSMPSPYSSEGTRADARAIAQNLGTEFTELDIEAVMEGFDEMLAGSFEGRDSDLTEENIQARIRGTTVMALSNKFGSLVLTTGNKSELSVGYATLYGDMAGGFAVLKDVYKCWVYRLVRWRNEQGDGELVPASVLDRPPSAELREEQLDEDSLPPYEVLDEILEGYIEGDLDAGELVRRGLPAEDVERVVRMVDGAEYKRRQSPPGIRISTRAFGRDRRLPITSRYESRVEPREGSRRLRAL